MTRVPPVVVIIACVVLAAVVSGQQSQSADDVLRVASQYVDSYAQRVSGVSLEEEYTLRDVSGGRLTMTRRITSDLVVLALAGQVLALRDPFAVDGNVLRERTPRITSLLMKPTAAAWDQAQAYAGESARFFQDDLILRLSTPMIALQFVAPKHQSRVAYKLEGRKKLAGIETVVLRFQENKAKSAEYILDTPGRAIASGRLWVDPATGRVHRTELSVQSDSESAHIVVDYARDPALDLWLPASMTDTYEVYERVGTTMTSGSGAAASGSGIGHRSYDCFASYTNARLTPIQMSAPICARPE